MAIEVFKLFGRIMVKNDEANKNISKTEEKAEGLGQKLIDGIGTAAKWGASIAAAAGTAALGLGTIAVRSADQFQKSLNQLQASTGATNEEMKALGEVVKGVYGNKFGESFEDVANAVELVTKNLGLQGQELQNVTELAIGFADTFGAEVGESTRSARTLMQQFGISAEEAYNLMTQGQQQGLDFSGELLDSINDYSVHFKQVGLDAEDMFNVFLDGSASGAFNLDKVGDAVKELGIKVKEGSANEALAELGFSADEVVSKFNKGGEEAKEAFYGIFEALGRVDDQTKLNTLGTELMGTMFEDLGKDAVIALGTMSDGFNRAVDSAKQVNSIKYNSFGDAITGIKRQLETNILIPIGDLVLPILNKFANWFSTVGQEKIQAFSNFIVSIMPYIQGIFTTAFELITGNADNAFSLLKNIFVDLKNKFIEIITSIIEVGREWLINNQDTVNKIIESFTTCMVYIKDIINDAVEIIMFLWNNFGKYIFDSIAFYIQLVLDRVRNVLGIIQGVFQVITSLIKGDWEGVWEGVKTVFSNALEFIVRLLIEQLLGNFIKKIGEWGSSLLGSIRNIFSNVTSSVGGLVSTIESKASGILSAITKPFAGAFDSVSSWISKIKNAVSNMFNTYIKKPHFSFSGSLNPMKWGSEGLPKLGIEWYAKGGVLHQPTVFGMNGPNAMVGGEAGPEAVAPIETLMDYVRTAVAEGMGNNGIDYSRLFRIMVEAFTQAIIATGMNDMALYVDKEKLGQAMAGTNDKIDGQRMKLAERGLILE